MADPSELAHRSARQRVLLVKTDELAGGLPVGHQYEVLWPIDLPRDVVTRRTFARLKRDYPAENPMCWTVDQEARAHVR